jgi:hypothetical protein
MDQQRRGPLRIALGEKLELLCAAKGNPLPLLTWYKDGKAIELDDTHSLHSAKLQVDNVGKSDSGVYSCHLENRHGAVEAIFHVFVGNDLFNLENFDVEQTIDALAGDTSMSIDQSYNSSVKSGHTAQLQCRVHWQQHVPTIRWLKGVIDPQTVKLTDKNATILHLNNMHLLLIEQPIDSTKVEDETTEKYYVNTLTISNVQSFDGGRYFCVVTNTAGQFVYRSAFLDVIKDDQFIALGGSPNVIFIVIIVVVLTIVTIAISWLCCYGTHSSLSSGSSVADQTKSSCDSTDCCTNSLKKVLRHQHPPPPPRIPVPETPPLSPAKTADLCFNPQQMALGKLPTVWPLQQQQQMFLSASMDRRYRPSPKQMLHRTHAEDEMSRLSSNIYDSGSVTPLREARSPLLPPHAQLPQRHWANTLPPPPRPSTPVSVDGFPFCNEARPTEALRPYAPTFPSRPAYVSQENPFNYGLRR